MDGSCVSIEIDNQKTWESGPAAMRQLARLANAIMARQALGDDFHPTIKIEVGNAVALLVSTVKENVDGSG
jgi:hypothetical protein